jgi:hypothetical protein
VPRRATASNAKTAAAAKSVAAWEDDPGDPKSQPASPIIVPVPKPAAQPLPFKIGGRTPAARIYQPDSAEFRFYATAAALRRTADFWGRVLGGGVTWEVGQVLPVVLDDGIDLNAFYTRGGFGDAPGLHFFHDTVSGRTFFSGESPDVACHEMGHAVLDAIKPKLYDAQTIEAAAFHESFGDMTALLSSLQVVSFRQSIIAETQGRLNRSSRLSRIADQLGAAIRVRHPDAVDPDCFRNAVNSFFYRDPQTLAPVAPAAQLSSEPHSFSRVFTAAFLDLMAAMFRMRGATPNAADLLTTTEQAAKLLAEGVRAAPIVPDFYSQVAAHMIDAGERPPFSGKFRTALKSAFVRRGILSTHAAMTVSATKARRGSRAQAAPSSATARKLPLARIAASQYGLSDVTLHVFTAEEPKQFAVTSSSLMLGPVEPRSAQNAAESFTEDLFQRGRIDAREHGTAQTALVHPQTMKTHVIVKERGDLVLRRRTFDCGFDAC